MLKDRIAIKKNNKYLAEKIQNTDPTKTCTVLIQIKYLYQKKKKK